MNVYSITYKVDSTPYAYSSLRKEKPFICELILERYIYLRNTQKQQKITSYVRNKSFLEFYLVCNGVCLKLLGSIL